jgi:hypothetical protein
MSQSKCDRNPAAVSAASNSTRNRNMLLPPHQAHQYRPRARARKVGWGGFDFADRCQSGFLSRRDKRTEPGVLTPGSDKKTSRPEGGGRTVATNSANVPKQSVNHDLRPFTAPRGLALFPGLKPQAESCSPFGTSFPQNQKAGRKLSRIPAHVCEARSGVGSGGVLEVLRLARIAPA